MYISPYTSRLQIQCLHACEWVHTRALCRQSYAGKVVCKDILTSHRRTNTRNMLKIKCSNFLMPIPLATLSKAWIIFARSNAWIVGSNPTRGMDVCVRLFCVYAAALRRADPPSKYSYRLCIRLSNWKSGQGPTQDCTSREKLSNDNTPSFPW
jgi:hypothetical protein